MKTTGYTHLFVQYPLQLEDMAHFKLVQLNIPHVPYEAFQPRAIADYRTFGESAFYLKPDQEFFGYIAYSFFAFSIL
jgi:hypothetical protein